MTTRSDIVYSALVVVAIAAAFLTGLWSGTKIAPASETPSPSPSVTHTPERLQEAACRCGKRGPIDG